MSKPVIPDFTNLTSAISLYTPPDSATRQHDTNTPSLIVYCSWMGAAPKHIAKYTDGYRRAFPTTAILLLQCSVAAIFTGIDLQPALDVINSHIQGSERRGGGSSSGVVICQASNGGGTVSTALALALQRTHGKAPFDAVVLDCCPGKAEVAGGAAAFSLSLPNLPYVRATGYWVLYVLLVLYVAFCTVTGTVDGITKTRQTLNDPEIFDRRTARLYLYSKVDRLVGYEHVHTHAEDARKAGFETVKEEVFELAPHCALIGEDGERYWGAVKDVVLGES